MVVEDIMSEDPFAVEVTEPLGEVVEKLLEADVRHLPVVEDGGLVGILSDRDLRVVAMVADGRDAVPETVSLSSPVGEIMSADVLAVNPEDDVKVVIDIMIEEKVGAVPVVEADSSRLVGIVSYIDALRAARDVV